MANWVKSIDAPFCKVYRIKSWQHLDEAHNIHQMLANLINQTLVVVACVCERELMCSVHNRAVFNALYGSKFVEGKGFIQRP